MSADAIAATVADLRAGRVRCTIPDDRELARLALVGANHWTVVDATAIYDSLADHPRPVAIYEDHPAIAPPWPLAAFCYVNGHGNVIVMSACSREFEGDATQQWEPAEPVEWKRVRWCIDVFVWVGGESHGSHHPTAGPAHLWQFAVYESGEPADLHWVHLMPEYPMERWDMAQLVVLGALNFLNCRNVDIVDPVRPRAEARRIARTGVRVHTLSVLPMGRASRSVKRDDPVGVPLTSVRGHFARYGPEFDRELLFGKYAGRYWIPQHARGDGAHGVVVKDYELSPERSR